MVKIQLFDRFGLDNSTVRNLAASTGGVLFLIAGATFIIVAATYLSQLSINFILAVLMQIGLIKLFNPISFTTSFWIIIASIILKLTVF
ncbi:MAG: hypothetical protein ACREBJ_05870 [Nitrosotalea sp.]